MDEMKESNIKALFLAIVGMHIVLVYCTLNNGHDWGGDFSQYIMQARSITEGKLLEFIEANRFTMLQSSYPPVAPVAYPWGFPVLLAPVYAAFGNSVIALKSIGAIFFVLFLFCLFIGFRKYHSPFAVLFLVCLFALNPYFLWHLNQILSDMPFLVFSTVAVLLMGELIITRRRFVSSAWDNFFLGAVIFAAYSIRTTGILLILTLGITQLISLGQRISRSETTNTSWPVILSGLVSSHRISLSGCLVGFLPYASFFGLSLLWSALLPDGSLSYVNYLGGISVSSVADNLIYNVKLPALFFSGPESKLLFLVGLVFHVLSLPCVFRGLIRRYRTDYHITVYVILTLLLCIIVPFKQGLRYLFPVLPFYLSFMLTGLEGLERDSTSGIKSLRKIANLAFVSLFILWLGILSRSSYINIVANREVSSGPFAATSRGMFAFITENVEPESTVIFFKPTVMRMMTGRQSIWINKTEELGRGDYLCLYRTNREDQVSPAVVREYLTQGMAQLVYENADFRVYRLKKEKDGIPRHDKVGDRVLSSRSSRAEG
jgi:hypothetical protein